MENSLPNISRNEPLANSGGSVVWLRKVLPVLLWTAILLYSVIHARVIVATAVDLPHYDEWELLAPEGVVQGWSLQYLLHPINEHKVVAAKILALINLRYFGLNFRYQIFFNLFLYSVLLASLWALVGRKIYRERPVIPMAAFFAMFSTLPFVFHTMGLLVHVHVTLLSIFFGTYLLFKKDDWTSFIFAVLLLILSIFNFSAAIGGAALVVLFYSIVSFKSRSPHFTLKPALAALTLGFSIVFWFQNYEKNPHHPPYVMPWSPLFVRFLSELTAAGFGYTDPNPLPAYISLIMVVAALSAGSYAFFKIDRSSAHEAFPVALMLGFLGMLFLIAFGRANFPLSQAKTSHYSEIVLFLPLLSLALFQDVPRIKYGGAVLVLLFLGLGIFDDFGFSGYQAVRGWRMAGKACLVKLLNTPQENPTAMCPTVYNKPVGEGLAMAKRLQLSFISSLQESESAAPR